MKITAVNWLGRTASIGLVLGVGRVMADSIGDFFARKLLRGVAATLFLSSPAVAAPAIRITSVPAYTISGAVEGVATGVDYSQARVAAFLYVPGLGWYTKPNAAIRTVAIGSDGKFSVPIGTDGLDGVATIYSVAIVAADYTPPLANPATRVPADLNAAAIDFWERSGPTLQFAGRTWAVKDAPSPVGTGPDGKTNRFSTSSSDVWADNAGLHLTLHLHADGNWWSTEVTLLGPHPGFGTYWYHTGSRTDLLDTNVTFGGGFTWDDYGDESSPDGSYFRELDAGEDSRWGDASAPNTQAAKQPFDYQPANRHRFNLPDLSVDPTLTRIMIWRADSVRFLTLKGNYSPVDYPPSAVVNDFTYAHSPASGQYVPAPGRERVHFNLWLNQTVNTIAPANGQPVEVVIKDFGFAPFTHSGDTDRDFRFSLLELTRVIELYNTRNGTTRTGCYRIDGAGEDGFAAEPARAGTALVTLTQYHSADSDHDGKLSLLELTRVIELYNTRSGTTRTGAYHAQAGTEDGYGPGP